MTTFLPDLAFGARMLLARPGFRIAAHRAVPAPADAVLYVPHLQQQPRWLGSSWDYRAMMAFVMRTPGEPMTLATSVRSAVAEIDQARPAGNMRTVEQYLGEQTRGLEVYAGLLGIFGAAAGLLAALGIYGVMADTVALRYE